MLCRTEIFAVWKMCVRWRVNPTKRAESLPKPPFGHSIRCSLNRLSGRAHVNVAALKKLLTEYIGGDLTLLGEVPDDPAMERAVRGYLPVADREPTAPAAVALAAIADALLTRMASPAS